MKNFRKKLVLFLAFFCVFTLTIPINVFAQSNMIPDYEVKLLIDSEMILNSESKLKKTYREIFNTGKKYDDIGVEYFDTSKKEFNHEGWINRIRIKEDKEKFELTYKKRYKIYNQNIDDALDLANKEGFDYSDTNYDAQVDWGYNNMTLSISRKKEISNKGYKDLELPKKKYGIKILKANMPGKEKDWIAKNWGTSLIESSEKYGPVYYKKYSGNYENIDLDIELWEIENAYGNKEIISELSFKTDSYEEAKYYREIMINTLQDLGILLHTDSLKTQKILGI